MTMHAPSAAPTAAGGLPIPPLRTSVPLLGSLYTAQYVGVGFIYFGLVAILRRQGIELAQLAAFQLIGAVWALKFLWAPLVDAVGRTRTGHYRNWILVVQPLLALSVLALLLIREPATQLGALGLIIGAYAFLSATQDIAADALAVRIVDARHRGVANGLAGAGSWLGNILGGGLVVVMYDAIGWTAAVVTLTVLTLLPLVLVLRFAEPLPQAAGVQPRSASSHPHSAEAPAGFAGAAHGLRASVRAMRSLFAQSGCRFWALAAMPAFLCGVTAAYGLLTVALVDAGWSLTAIGVLMGIVLGFPAIAASLGSGWLLARFGRRTMILATGIAAAAATLGLLPLMGGDGSRLAVVAGVCLYVAAMAAASTVVYTVNMDYSRVESAGVDFTLLASTAILFSYVSGALMTWLADSLGYVLVTVIASGLALLGTGLAALHAQRHGVRAFAAEERAH
ncbi:MFS transporter [Brevibacterium sp. CS2]|uniref:MFS transporter n=1 Tax=Brevibacterium sp. CS2 TaxID=2575923 RepID=UPI0010C773D8|nr:MFS transporter [Brevibacterium sp. CS2]QCP04337.1 MFS transporter [Brevibacterium sp. CS2]